jgi:hypothetical protein
MKEIKRLARCERGHFYDAGKYDVCPHCENTQEIPVTKLERDWELPSGADTSESVPAQSRPAENKDVVREQVCAPMQGSFMDPGVYARDDSMTVHYYQKTLGTEPVVGWLVCVSGVHFGQDYRIKSGRNFVGRSGSMDVCLSGDTAVSRDRHLIVTYDPKGRSFFAQPGDTSSALSYLNDKPLLEASELKTGDKLTVGESELMFVAFCGKDFSWEK